MEQKRYNEYHKHCHESNKTTPDCVVKPIDYINRAKELGHTTYFTTQHGWTGQYLAAYDLCKQNNLKMIYGAELYAVKDRFEKDSSNCHIIVVGKNQDAFYEMNEIMSKSNTEGYYYKPRVDLQLLTSLNPNNFIITSACVAGILRNDETTDIFLEPLIKHFGNNFYFEVQPHKSEIQYQHNLNLLRLRSQYHCKLIHANDSHYIYPEQAKDRAKFLKGKGMNYADEDGFILDYPDYDTIVERYHQQGLLVDWQIKEALDNTLIFDNCEDLHFDKEIKMPTIYPNEDSNQKLKTILVQKWKEEKPNVNPDKIPQYLQAINYEYQIVKKTNMADYFLLNERIVALAKEKYNGVLSRTGRGCFTKDALVHTKNSLKTIDKVVVGDEIIDMYGQFKKVINTMSYNINEELVQIKHLYGTDKYYPTICTKDHKILINRNNKIKWIQAQNIKIGDYVCVPKPQIKEQSEKYIDLNKYNVFGFKYDDQFIYEYNPYMNNYYQFSPVDVAKHIGVGENLIKKLVNGDIDTFKRKPKKYKEFLDYIPFNNIKEYRDYIREKRTIRINRYIKNDYIFNQFIGLLYGDGFNVKNKITIGLAINTDTQKDKINKDIFYTIAKRLNLSVYSLKSKTKKLEQISINSKIFHKFVSDELFVSEKNKSKQFNPKFFTESILNQKGILNGLFLSDGSNCEKRDSFDNTSLSLINAYKILSLNTRYGINSLSIRKAHLHGKYQDKESYKLRHPNNMFQCIKKTNRCLEDNQYWYLPIKEIKILPKQKTEVYDLTIEDSHSYLINNMVVHNSAVSFYINKLLGFTEIDRLESEVPLYPTRFMSVARILQTRSLPDIDQNWADVSAPIQATKELLGEDGVYYMYALGTMKESSAFRNLCRAYDMDMNEYNEVAKNLDQFRNDKKWQPIIEESQKFIGVIDSVAPSPCSFVLSNKALSKELGLIRVGDVICASIDGYTADVWKFLKNDYLTVKVWKIISDCYKLLNKPIPNIRQLKTLLDDNVWNLYRDGLTATLNQADTDISTSMLKRYKPHNVAEMSGFVAAIRPGFASLVNTFLNREEYSTGVDEIDKILEPSYHFMLYQESIMAFLVWCGLPEDHTYDIIKKISKKKFTPEEQEELRLELIKGYKNKLGTEKGFEEIWQVVNDAARYSFNASHSLSVAWDSLYGAELKAHYPLEYYTTVLNEYQNDTEKTGRIISELSSFGISLENIKFGKSKSVYSFDKNTKTIYKSVSSIKYCNEQIADELYNVSQNYKLKSFTDVLKTIKSETSINTRQLQILTTLNYFSDYGKNKKLLQIINLYENLADRKQIKKSDIEKFHINESLFKTYCNKETDKLYKDIDIIGYINEVSANFENKSLSVKEQIQFEMQYLEYITYTNSKVPNTLYYVSELKTYKDVTKPYLLLYNLNTGVTLKTKVTEGRKFSENPFKQGNLINVKKFKEKNKMKKINNSWIKTNEKEKVVSEWDVY